LDLLAGGCLRNHWQAPRYFKSKIEQTMPEITIELNEGRSIEQKRALCKGITDVVVETCKVPADRVVITIHETLLVNKAVGGVLFADHIPAA
jgi:4-oxalocrotonate tautomerase